MKNNQQEQPQQAPQIQQQQVQQQSPREIKMPFYKYAPQQLLFAPAVQSTNQPSQQNVHKIGE